MGTQVLPGRGNKSSLCRRGSEKECATDRGNSSACLGERGQSRSVQNFAHHAEVMKSCGKILGKLTLAVVRKDWLWGQDRKMGYEANTTYLHKWEGGR